MKSIYIMLTRSETILSRLVYLVTRDAYTHASIPVCLPVRNRWTCHGYCVGI